MIEQYRQEHKYQISRQTLELLRRTLPKALSPDPHAGPDGSYWIRSLYFDDTEHSAYREKLSGIKDRRKFRIRFYDFDTRFIILEKKERSGDQCRKFSQVIGRQTARELAAGLPSGGGNALLEEFDLIRSTTGLRPSVIVDYRRWAFGCSASNTRVTLDAELCTPVYSTDIFDRSLPCYPVLESDEALVEVKFDDLPPPFVTALLSGVPKVKIAMSKFTQCVSMLNE